MNFAGNFEDWDLMKRASSLVQGHELHSQMLASSILLDELQKAAYF